MTTYIALLRAVNVGGTGKLPMADLKAMCAELGFGRVETYIASGNVVFDCDLSPAQVKARLDEKLIGQTGKKIASFVRTAFEMQAVLMENPFKDRDPRQVYAFFLESKAPEDFEAGIRGRCGETIGLGQREIYVFYPAGMGQSKLRIPAAEAGTARNLNTVAKLVEMSARR